jgi:hypothetical protein
VIAGAVDPLPVPLPFHNKVQPAAGVAVLKVVDPQLLTMLITGVAGIAFGADMPEPAELVQPFAVCVTV